jgi:hypothetical protein
MATLIDTDCRRGHLAAGLPMSNRGQTPGVLGFGVKPPLRRH